MTKRDASHISDGKRLWAGATIPKSRELPRIKDMNFHVIKSWRPERDGYEWLHGVALAWHGDILYASFGLNQGSENTPGERACGRTSSDGGKNWEKFFSIDEPEEDNLGISHGVFLSYGERLWAFQGAFYGRRQDVHTRAYILDEENGRWESRCTVVDGGFWPMQEPLKMDNGCWIMSGIAVGEGNPAAVAISCGDDLTRWERIVIPQGVQGSMWGESTVFIDGDTIINIARYGEEAKALVAVSSDCGRSWTPSQVSNLPMTTSKPYTGTLSTGQHYLICTTTADSGKCRFPLTIAVTAPGETAFSRVFCIRDAEFEGGPGESHPDAGLSYPYAVEYDGKLFVGYSNNGGRGGNRNSAELAIIPVSSLKAAGT